MKTVRTFAALVVTALMLGACSSTHVLMQWRDNSYAGPPFSRVAVMMLSEDVTMRRLYEDQFARRLEARGINAAISYGSIPTPKVMECDKVEKMVCDLGTDGTLVIRVVKQETRYENIVSQPFLLRDYLDTYSSSTIQYDVATLEAKLFRMPRGTLVWSGTMQTIDRIDMTREVATIADQVISALDGNGLLRAK